MNKCPFCRSELISGSLIPSGKYKDWVIYFECQNCWNYRYTMDTALFLEFGKVNSFSIKTALQDNYHNYKYDYPPKEAITEFFQKKKIQYERNYDHIAQGMRKKKWREKYDNYLKSDEWKEKRKRILERDNYICQCCLINKATEVHHLSYHIDHDEPAFDLISVCRLCHEKITSRTQSTPLYLIKKMIFVYCLIILSTISYSFGQINIRDLYKNSQIIYDTLNVDSIYKVCEERGHVPGNGCVTTAMYCPPYLIETDSTTIKVYPKCNSMTCTCIRCGKEITYQEEEYREVIWRKPREEQ